MPVSDSWLRDLMDLKRTPRSGWLRAGVVGPESVADHSFATALLAWQLAREQSGVDPAKVLLMALLHDYHEARLGDIPAPVKERFPPAEVERAEGRVMDEQWEGDPQTRALLEELRAGESEEARLVWAVDHLELLVQAARYYQEGYREVVEMLRRARGGRAFEHPATRPLARAILAKHGALGEEK